MPVLRKRAQQDSKPLTNGLYIHSNPPRVLGLNSAHIKQLIRVSDLDRLEQIVLDGYGKKLLGEYSADYKTRTFLKSVPSLMTKISLLQDAVNSGKLEEVKSILNEEPDKKKRLVMCKDEAGVGLLHKAVYYDLKDIYKYFIENFPHMVSMRDSEGRTAYHYSLMCRDTGMVQKLLTHAGADPNSLDNRQHSVKYYANHMQELELPSCQKSEPSTRKGTATNESLNFKKSNIRIWIHQRNLLNLAQVVLEGHGSKLLVEHSNNPKMKKFLEAVPHIMGLIKEIHNDVQRGDLESLKGHVSPPIPPMILCGKDGNGLTPLHKAAGLGKDNIAEYIVSTYPNSVNVQDNEGRTPLHYASLLKDDGKMMNFLIQNGADESVLDSKQKSAGYYKMRYSELDSKLLSVLPECPRSAKETLAANFDWSMLSSVIPIGEVQKVVKKVEKIFGGNTEETKKPVIEELTEHNGNVDHDVVSNGVDNSKQNGNTENNEETEENESTEIPADEENLKNEENSDENHNNEEESNINQTDDKENETDEIDNSADKNEDDKNDEQEEDNEPQATDDIENNHDEENDSNNNTTDTIENNTEEHKENDDDNNEQENLDNGENQENTEQNGEDEQGNENIEEKETEEPDRDENSVEPAEEALRTRPNSHISEDGNRPSSNSSLRPSPSPKSRVEEPVVEAEGVIEGIVNGENEIETLNNEGRQNNFEGMPEDEEIRAMVETGNMEQLASLVLNGEGDRLVGQTSENAELQSFLDNVPIYMSKINRIHVAARDGSLRDLQAALDRRKFAIAKDKISPNGASPLHVAIMFGNTSIVRYLAGRFPETVQVVDENGRTPLHYAAVLADNGHYYNLLVHLGADTRIPDKYGHTPEHYRSHQDEFSHRHLLKQFGAEEAAVEEMLNDKEVARSNNGQVDMPFFATEEGRYLASSLGDPLIKGLTEVANKRPEDPIAYLATYLYNFANGRGMSRGRPQTQENHQIISGSPQLVNDNNAVPATIDVVTVEPEEENVEEDSAFQSTSRDEHGQSMLHFAAARAHGRNALFQLLLETEINVAYRDELYRTARDISIQANLAENTEEIDRYVLHIATKGDTDKLVELLLDGYDHITDIVDEEDVPIVEAVAKHNQPETVSFLQSILTFEEKRERVHHAIRQGSLSIVSELLADENDTGSGKLLAIGKNSFGRCTLHIAVLCQQEEIVDYISNTFPDTLRLGDNLERTALHYAMGVEKMESISRVLIKAGAKRVIKDLKGRQPTYYFLNKSEILRLQEEEETF